MRLPSARVARRLAIGLASLALGAATVFAWSAWQARHIAALASDTAPPEPAVAANPSRLAAQEAIVLALRASRNGDTQTAHVLLRHAATVSDSVLKSAALYNAGNLHLREALAAQAAANDQQAFPLAELAKESFRAALAEQPQMWDARYNLERALVAFPDVTDSVASTAPQPPRERAVTTMRGFTLGLP